MSEAVNSWQELTFHASRAISTVLEFQRVQQGILGKLPCEGLLGALSVKIYHSIAKLKEVSTHSIKDYTTNSYKCIYIWYMGDKEFYWTWDFIN